jgi:hypothetical protein
MAPTLPVKRDADIKVKVKPTKVRRSTAGRRPI